MRESLGSDVDVETYAKSIAQDVIAEEEVIAPFGVGKRRRQVNEM